MNSKNDIYPDLKLVKELVYDKCGFQLTNLKLNLESLAYGACSFELDGKKIEHRTAKITLTKTGQFVTIWKRNINGITEPFDILDEIDFIVITAKSGDNFGQFIFPKSVLVDKGIMAQNGKAGKRGIRVYPTWDALINKQAEKTQIWQTKYFITIGSDNSAELDRAKKIFCKINEN